MRIRDWAATSSRGPKLRHPFIVSPGTDANQPRRERSPPPEWVLQPFRDFRDSVRALDDLLTVVESGLASTVANPALFEALIELERLTQPRKSKAEKLTHLARAKAEAALAERELDGGMASLTALWAVAGWGYLEAHFEEIMLSWLANAPGAVAMAAESQVHIPLATYLAADDDERLQILYQELEKKQAGKLHQGVGRFETILRVFGIGGDVDAATRKTLFEFNEVRNCLVHRRGLADRRLVHACPWLGIGLGDRVVVSRADLDRYLGAGVSYFHSIATRLQTALDASRRDGNERRDEDVPSVDADPTSSEP